MFNELYVVWSKMQVVIYIGYEQDKLCLSILFTCFVLGTQQGVQQTLNSGLNIYHGLKQKNIQGGQR